MSHKEEAAVEIGIAKAYDNLAKRVVLQAVMEYKTVRSQIRNEMAKGGLASEGLIIKCQKLEHFFDSDWCDQLCGFDGSAIKQRLNRR